MLYQAYQTHSDLMLPVRALASVAASGFAANGFAANGFAANGFAANGFAAAGMARAHGFDHGGLVRNLTAAYEIISRAGLTHRRPAFGIARTTVGDREVEVTEEVAHATPFGTLLHFRKDTPQVQPRVLLVAPLSGHFATLLRGTVKTMLPEHDVYITDWHNARDVATAHGAFGFDDCIAHIVTFLEAMGPPAHVVAVCQPCVATLAACAAMAEEGHAAEPRSLTLMAGPIDTRVNPTRVNELATSRPISWFEQNLIARVPFRFDGAFRRVYPGFVQLAAFMSMNIERHLKAHRELYENLAKGEHVKAQATKDFYDEYFAVLDLTAEFYLETVRLVFQEHALPLGTLGYRGRRIDPSAIRNTMLLTVEGEKDDICAIGQTVAAHDLCASLAPRQRRHHLQAGVGHYGVFSGRRWENEIYPLVRNVILASE